MIKSVSQQPHMIGQYIHLSVHMSPELNLIIYTSLTWVNLHQDQDPF